MSASDARVTADFDVSSFRRAIPPGIHGIDRKYTLYHDETNNFRKLTLASDGSINVASLDNFVLGGIALLPSQTLPDVEPLRAQLKLQSSTREIKLRHIAAGTFTEILASPKLAIFLKWLLEHRILIHYSNINVLHWSLIDIVDSMLVEEKLRAYLPEHVKIKNELYRIAKLDRDGFLAMLGSFDYPNLAPGRAPVFLKALEAFIDFHCPEDIHLPVAFLRQMVRQARKFDSLTFLEQNENGELIDSFWHFFLQPLCVFSHSEHIFDRETTIEKRFAPYRIVDGAREIRFRFANSHNEVGIQLSDVVVGLLGKFFVCAENHSMRQLMSARSAFSATQRTNLDLMRRLIDSSVAISDAFLIACAPFDSNAKSQAFLNGTPLLPHVLEGNI